MNKNYILLILFCYSHLLFSQNIDSLKQQLKLLPDGKEKVSTYDNLITYYHLLDIEEVLDYGKKGIKLSQELNFVSGEASLNVNIGNAYSYIDQHSKAKPYYERAIYLANVSESKNILAKAYNNIGIVFDEEGNLDKALQFYQRSYKLKMELGEEESANSTVMNIGGIYFFKGYYHKALKSFLESEKISISMKDTLSMALCAMNIYVVYEKLGRYEEAIKKVRSAINYLETTKQEKYLTEVYQKIATSKISLNEFDSSEYYLKKGLQIAQIAHDSSGLALIYNSMASLYLKRNNFSEALLWAEKAKQIREARQDVFNYPTMYGILAETYYELGDSDNAEKYILKAIEVSKKMSRNEALIEIYRSASKIYNEKKEYEKALDYYVLYDKLEDSIEGTDMLKRVNELELQNERERQQVIVNLLEKEKQLKEMQLKKNQYAIWSVSTGLLVVLFFLFIVFRNYRQKQKANIEISYQKNIIEEKNKDITDSINYASRIQNTILPDSKIFTTYFSDSFVFYRPKDIVSGDFYFAEEKNGKIYFAVVDCTGHGVPGALVSVFGYNGLRRCINEYHLSKPAEILDKLSSIVEESFKTKGKEVADGMDLSLCVYDKSTKTLEYAGANNPLWVHQNSDIIQVKGDKQPVGHYHNRKPFTNHSISLNKGDSLYLFSDGFADQFGGEKGKKFKYSQFRQMVLDNVSKPMSEQKIIVERSFEKWKGNLEQVDDICILGIQV